MLTLENAGALVSGGPLPKDTNEESRMLAPQSAPKRPETQRVEVLRAFYHDKKLHAVGSKPTLPFLFALEMRNANKVAFIAPEEPTAPIAPASTESTAGARAADAEMRSARNGGNKSAKKGEANAQ